MVAVQRYNATQDYLNNKLIHVASPIDGTDAANKAYVDANAQGLVWKDAARAASTSNVNLSTPGVIDGVTLTAGDRVLLMGQTDAKDNGLYVLASGALVRAIDADSSAKLRGGTIATVSEGTTHGNKTYVMTTDGPITLGTTALNWTLANNNTAKVYSAGNGIYVGDDGVIDVTASTNGGLSSNSDGVAIVARPNGGVYVNSLGIGVNVGQGLDVDGDNNIEVPIDAESGLVIEGGKLAVKAGTGLVRNSDGLVVSIGNGLTTSGSDAIIVEAKTAGGIESGSHGVAVKAGAGIHIDADGVAVARGEGVTADGDVGVVPGDGLVIDGANAVAVLTDGTSLATSSAGIKVNADPDGLLVIGGAGLGVDTTKVARKYSEAIGDGVATVIDITHGLNTRAVSVEVIANSAPYDTIGCGVSRPDTDTVELEFGVAPTAGEYLVVVVG